MVSRQLFIPILILIMFNTSFVFAQNINQYDAQNKRHGIWKKKFENTSVLRYEGAFFHGKEIGVFKFYSNINNQAVLKATKEFNDANNLAYVKFYESNDKLISEGEMDGDKFIGFWKYYHSQSNTLLTTENYNNNSQLHGERLVYYPNGNIAEKQHYNHGVLEGTALLYSETQVVLKTYNYKNGQLHGHSKFYNPQGELITEGTYKDDKKVGVWKFYEKGKLVNQQNLSKPSQKKQ